MDEQLKAVLNTGREHFHKREYAKAEPLLEQVAAHEHRYADVFNMLGVLAHERGDFEHSEKCFERAIELNPHYTEALLNLAVTYNEQAKYEAANNVYRQARSGRDLCYDGVDPFIKGKIANMHAELAQAYDDAGMQDQAVHELEKAIALCPTFADLHTRLGTLLRNMGNLRRAKEQYEIACEVNPRYVPGHLMLGLALVALNDLDGAAQSWRTVLRVDPDHKLAKMYLRMVQTAPRSSRPPAP